MYAFAKTHYISTKYTVFRELIMAGDGSVRSTAEYAYDESKYKGFSKYYNTETPRGRAGVC